MQITTPELVRRLRREISRKDSCIRYSGTKSRRPLSWGATCIVPRGTEDIMKLRATRFRKSLHHSWSSHNKAGTCTVNPTSRRPTTHYLTMSSHNFCFLTQNCISTIHQPPLNSPISRSRPLPASTPSLVLSNPPSPVVSSSLELP